MAAHCVEKDIKLIAIAGPTASGKTMLGSRLAVFLDKRKTIIISQDNYYKDWSHLSLKKRKKINFDALNSFDTKLLKKHLVYLKGGQSINMPLYDFVQSRRLEKSKKINPSSFVIVEGLIPFFNRGLRKIFDYKVYLSTEKWLCLSRRITRDTKERGESVSSVCQRYFEDVLVMQKKYVEPQKQWADMVVDGSRSFGKKLISSIAVQCKK